MVISFIKHTSRSNRNKGGYNKKHHIYNIYRHFVFIPIVYKNKIIRYIIRMKYLGGKQRLGKHISPKLHDIWDKNEKLVGYMEPFCGSLGVLRNMHDIDASSHANDYHSDLIKMWKEVKSGKFKYPTSCITFIIAGISFSLAFLKIIILAQY